MEHLLVCPALEAEQNKRRILFQEKLAYWQVPWGDKQIVSFTEKTCLRWFNLLKPLPIFNVFNHKQLHRMIEYFHLSSMDHPNVAFSKLKKSLMDVKTYSDHCRLPFIPQQLSEILTRRLHLQLEGTTNVLHRSERLTAWCSDQRTDVNFGSLGPVTEKNLEGFNSLVLLSSTPEQMDSLIAQTLKSVSSKKPTRIVLIGPSRSVGVWLRPVNRRILELARSEASFPLFHCNGHHHPHLSQSRSVSNEPISIILAMNKESMILDPIDWAALKHDLLDWAEAHCPNLQLGDLTDKLFRERICPSHLPRVNYVRTPPMRCAYKFFEPGALKKGQESHLIVCGISPELAKTHR